MEKFQKILLDVWREACKHIQITESIPVIAKLLVKRLPFSQLLVRCVDVQKNTIDTRAIGFSIVNENLYSISHIYSKKEIEILVELHKKNMVLHRVQNKQNEKVLQLLVPGEIENDILAGPAGCKDNFCFFLILIAKPGAHFVSSNLEMMKTLSEPMTAALENDYRLNEMTKLKEAAEADRKSLLAKLSRKTMTDTIVGADSGLKNVMERVNIVAKSDVPVLIFGETGTGKELIARAIHNGSNRSEGPFIRVNCGAIPGELIDSQLFGHEKGAFTGAVESRKGWFERADGGTLFLDEIGELPLEAQVRFLRILQDGWMERIGAKKPLKVNVRIVLATHRDLAAMVAAGKFREDLWYRIATFPIVLPPLRERIEDMKVLAIHFAERSAIRFGLPVLLPTQQDLKLLAEYPWPGNIRELGAVIDRAALLGNGEQLEIAKALGLSNAISSKIENTRESGNHTVVDKGICPLDEAMKRHIQAALQSTHGRIEGKNGAAELLEINPHTLRARMRKLGIRWGDFRDA